MLTLAIALVLLLKWDSGDLRKRHIPEHHRVEGR